MVIVRVANVLSVSRPHLPAVVYLALKCRDVFHDFAYLFPFLFLLFYERDGARETIGCRRVILHAYPNTRETFLTRTLTYPSPIYVIESVETVNNLAQIFIRL